MDLLINKFVFNDYYDLYLEYMIIFNGFIGFYQLSVFAMGYIIDIISKLIWDQKYLQKFFKKK